MEIHKKPYNFNITRPLSARWLILINLWSQFRKNFLSCLSPHQSKPTATEPVWCPDKVYSDDDTTYSNKYVLKHLLQISCPLPHLIVHPLSLNQVLLNPSSSLINHLISSLHLLLHLPVHIDHLIQTLINLQILPFVLLELLLILKIHPLFLILFINQLYIANTLLLFKSWRVSCLSGGL